MPLKLETLAQSIDHTWLKPNGTEAELRAHCAEALRFNFKTVCVPPVYVKLAARFFSEHACQTQTITVVGFPLGYSVTESKIFESQCAIKDGATEIDMVINLTQLKSQNWDAVYNDIHAVVNACQSIPVKVIIETAYLTTDEKIKASLISEKAGAKFVKTSTGFATGVPITGATLDDIRLIRKTIQPTTLIKASGGIRDLKTACDLMEAGANRLGTSSGVAILQGLTSTASY